MSLLTGQFLTMTLEDGEKVVRLRGGRRLGWKSDRPHAGAWGQDRDYVLVPCATQRSCSQRASYAVSRFPGLENRSSEVEVLLLGSPDLIVALVAEGPLWARALISRKGRPRSEAQQAAAAKLGRKS